MGIKINELYPAPQCLKINKESLELNYLTLKIEVELIDKFGTLAKALHGIAKTPEQLFDVVYILLKDKSRFNSPSELKKFICTPLCDLGLQDKASICVDVIEKIINKSMPLIKNKKRYQEISQLKNNDVQTEPCYLSYYDLIAKRYGHTLDQFYQLTMRQIHMMLNHIGDKSYEELEIQAALQGRKLKPRIKYEDVTPEQEEDQERQAMEALKQLQKRYKENN